MVTKRQAWVLFGKLPLLPFKEEGAPFLHIYLFLRLCSLPEKLVSCDSGSLKLSWAPPSTSLGVIAAPHGGALLGDCAKQRCAIASDKQLAFSKLKFPHIQVIIMWKYEQS